MLHSDQFQGREGQDFTMESAEGHRLDVILVELELLRHSMDGARPGFSLIFESAAATHWPQGNYRVHHAELAPEIMLLVPVGPSPKSGRMCYQAIFN